MSPRQPRARNSPDAIDGRLFADAALQAASGPKVFERGRTYASSGAVRIIEEPTGSNAQIRAQIDGTQTWETAIRLEEGAIRGTCDCPHAADGWFCKHQVALCLVWRDRLEGKAPVVDDATHRKVQAAARRAQTQRDRTAALHEFLRAQPAAVLAERLIELSDHYREIDRTLRLWQKSSTAAAAPEGLRALITDALAIRGGFLPWNQVQGWTRQAATILPLLREARERDAGSAAAIALHALRRCWTAMQKADDSSGTMGDLCSAIVLEWVACLQATAPQPAIFGDTWLRVQLEDPFGCIEWQSIEARVGAAALAKYRTLLAAEWQKSIESQSRESRAARRSAGFAFSDEADFRRQRIEALHVEQLEKTGDIDGALAVLRSDLSEPRRCRAVTAFLEAHGRLREAFASAEDAGRRFPDDWQVEADLLRAYERDGWLAEAHALRRRQFEARPDVERYTLALQSGVAADLDRKVVRAQLFAFMEKLEDQQMRSVASQRNVSLRAQVLQAENRLAEALQLTQPPHVCHPQVLRAIALALGKAQRKEAVALLQRVFDFQMRTAQTPYREELALVNEIAARLDAKSCAAWLARLRSEYKARRNFVRDLPGG